MKIKSVMLFLGVAVIGFLAFPAISHAYSNPTLVRILNYYVDSNGLITFKWQQDYAGCNASGFDCSGGVQLSTLEFPSNGGEGFYNTDFDFGTDMGFMNFTTTCNELTATGRICISHPKILISRYQNARLAINDNGLLYSDVASYVDVGGQMHTIMGGIFKVVSSTGINSNWSASVTNHINFGDPELPYAPPPVIGTPFTDNFNSYSDGNLGGQGGWTGAGGFTQVGGGITFEGGKAVSIYEPYPGTYNIEKSGALTNDGKITVYVRGHIGGSSFPEFEIQLKEGSTVALSAKAHIGYDFLYYNADVGGYTHSVIGLGGDRWYAVQIEWRSFDHKARYRIDNGDFTDWHKGLADWSQGLDTVNIGLADGAGWIDTIQENPVDSSLFDNFNSYNNGNLLGQGGWTPYPGYTQIANYTIQSSVTNEGAGALAVTGPTDNGSLIYKVGTEKTDGTMTFYFKATDVTNSGGFIFIGNGDRLFFGVNINKVRPGYVAYLNGHYGTTPDMVDTANAWHYAQIQWRSSDHAGRYNVDGGVWTEYVPSSNPWTSGGINSVILGGNNISGATMYFDTFQENPIPKKTPVLIVPGLMGTEMFKGNEKLWLDLNHNFTDIGDEFMDPLKFKSDVTPSDINLSLGDVITKETANIGVGKILLFDYTFGLTQEFKNQGYIENQNLFTFPYDWRYGVSGKYADGKTNSDLLAQKIQDIMQQTGSDKVDIVAHSQGGLIVKKYVIDHSTDNHISKAVFVGVPNTGSPLAIKVFLQGIQFDIPWLSEAEVKKISENMPTAYDLLPSQQYYNVKGSFVKVITESGFAYSNYSEKDLNYDEFKSYITDDHHLNSQALTNAVNLHTQDFDNFDLRTAGVDLYAIDGCKTGTLTKIVEDRKIPLIGSTSVDYKSVTFNVGDNTVPISSSTNLPINQEHKFFLLNTDHGKMLSQDGSRQEIVNIISGSNLNTGKTLFGNDLITQDISKCHLDGKDIEVFSPVDILAIDQYGNQTGNAGDGSILGQIPNADFEMLGDHKFLYLPTDEGQIYSIQLKGTGSGTYTIGSQNIVNSQVTNTEIFSDLPVTPDLTGQVNLIGAQTTLTIKQTSTSDSQTIYPSSNIDANQSQDFAPPISTATLTGKTFNEGKFKDQYKKEATVTINANDQVLVGHETETSGVLNITYNLDNAGIVKVAGDSATFTIQAEGAHTLSFFATDKAGNNEVAQTITFTIKKDGDDKK